MRGVAGGPGTLGVAAALAALLFLSPAGAAASQTWVFSDERAGERLEACQDDGCRVMYREPADVGEDETLVNEGEVFTWLADDAASTDVDFGTGIFSLELGCDSDSDGTLVTALGTVDASGEFTTEGSSTHDPQECDGDGISAEFSVDGFTVPEGDRLAVQLELAPSSVLALDAMTVFGDQTKLTSPESDPGYPVWELGSLFLLLGGIAAIALLVRSPASW